MFILSDIVCTCISYLLWLVFGKKKSIWPYMTKFTLMCGKTQINIFICLYSGFQSKTRVNFHISGCRGWIIWFRSMDVNRPEDRNLFRYSKCEQVELELQNDLLCSVGCRRVCSADCVHGVLWGHTEKQMFINCGMYEYIV